MAGSERNEILLPSDEQKAGLPGDSHTPTPMLAPNMKMLDKIDKGFPIKDTLNKNGVHIQLWIHVCL